MLTIPVSGALGDIFGRKPILVSGMLIFLLGSALCGFAGGIFELIALKQDEYDTYQAYLEAIRDYWLARAELTFAAGTTLPSSAQIEDRKIGVDELVRPAPGGGNHSQHRPSSDQGAQGDNDPYRHNTHQHDNHGGAS